MTSSSGRQVVTIHISPITQELKVMRQIQSVKFGQLIEYNMRNIFLEKSQNVVEKFVPDLFLQKPRFNISLDQQSEIL